jgi:hypothetical protein
MTTYIVLQRLGGTELRLLGSWAASGPSQAIKEMADGEEGTYIAVPERNWTEQHLELLVPAARVILRDAAVGYPAEVPAGQETIPVEPPAEAPDAA